MLKLNENEAITKGKVLNILISMVLLACAKLTNDETKEQGHKSVQKESETQPGQLDTKGL